MNLLFEGGQLCDWCISSRNDAAVCALAVKYMHTGVGTEDLLIAKLKKIRQAVV